MCCSTTPTWQGGRCAPPLHPPGLGSFRGSTPCQSHPTVSPVDHSQGDFALPAPIDLRAFLPPKPLTISWRPTLRGLDTASTSPLDPIRGLPRHPEPTRRTRRHASPPAPHHAQAAARLTGNQGTVPAAPDTPMTISWRPGKELSRCPCPGPIPSTGEPSRPWTPDQP